MLRGGPAALHASYAGVRSSADTASQRFWAPCRLIPKALPIFSQETPPAPCGGHGFIELGLQLLEAPAQSADAVQRHVRGDMGGGTHRSRAP